MNVPGDQLEHIYQKYINNECTPEELEWLVNALGEEPAPGREDVVMRLFDQTWEQLQEQPGKYPLPGNGPLMAPVRSTRRYWWSAAAAAILVIAVSTYLLRPSARPGAEQQAHAVIEPGREGAQLTLGDGSVVELSGPGGGVVAVQAGSNIAMDSGKLTYQPGAAEAAATVMNALHTPAGRMFQLLLPDGTAVWLNAASTLRYPAAFSGSERVVELEGEAYFEVAKAQLPDGQRMPFHVKTAATGHLPGQVVEVLGTHFNINSYANEPQVTTTLLEGRIRVNGRDLVPGEQAVLTNNGTAVRKVDTEEAVSWKNGYFRFDGEKIQSVMRKIERWYNVEAAFRGEITGEEFSGTISRRRSIGEVLELLESTKIVHFKTEGRKIIVSQ